MKITPISSRSKLFLLVTLLLTSANSLALPLTIRDEAERYKLLRDRILVERALKGKSPQSFFSGDLHISSGLKSLIGDLNSVIDNPNYNSTQKASEISNILNQNTNTEKFVDADAYVGVPLPEFTLKGKTFYPALFYNLNAGGSFSIVNPTGGNLKAQAFVKVDEKIGARSGFLWSSTTSLELALYQLTRKDLNVSKSAAQIEADHEFAEFDGNMTKQSSFRVDLHLTRKTKYGQVNFRVEEFTFLSPSDKTKYGNHAFLDLRYYHNIPTGRLTLRPTIGVHYRDSYDFIDGIYVAAELSQAERPYRFLLMLDTGMLTTSFSIHSRYIQAGYALKLPHENPVDHVWVSKIHSLFLQVPF